MNKVGKPISAAKKDRIKHAYRMGRAVKEIAEEFDVSLQTVYINTKGLERDLIEALDDEQGRNLGMDIPDSNHLTDHEQFNVSNYANAEAISADRHYRDMSEIHREADKLMRSLSASGELTPRDLKILQDIKHEAHINAGFRPSGELIIAAQDREEVHNSRKIEISFEEIKLIEGDNESQPEQ